MKKILFSAAIAALAMSSCSNDENLGQNGLDGAIAFDVYTARTANRAQAALTPAQQQSITTDVLKGCTEGFGVYAYETGAQKFKSYLANNTYPTFMFNQQVTFDLSAPDTEVQWKYNPVKYWPNDDSHVTFQAYAPYKKNKEVLFDVKYNGVGIRYGVDEAYDLLWGAQGYDGPQAVCFYDQQKPGILDKTKFMFKHALSKVDFTVSYNADKMDCTTPDGLLDENTEIVIRSIKLLGTLPSQGVLSLYDGSWTVEKVVENKFEYDTDFFGFTDKIGNLDGATATTDALGTLTHDINKLYANQSIMLIPAKTDVKLEISYDVVTKDANGFPGHTKNITVVSDDIPTYWGNTHAGETGTAYIDPVTGQPNHNAGAGQEDKPGIFTFDAGKWTTINIHLGMTSVKLDAEVKEWITDESGSIDMPANRDQKKAETIDQLNTLLADGATDVVLTEAPTTPVTVNVPKQFATDNSKTVRIEVPETSQTITINYVAAGSGSHVEGDKAPANIQIDAPNDGGNIVINTPDSHVTLNGEVVDVTASTSGTTFVLPATSKITGTLTVKEGGVELYGPVANLVVAPTEGKKVLFRDCVGLSDEAYNVAKNYLAYGYDGKKVDGKWNIESANFFNADGAYHIVNAKGLVEFAEMVNTNKTTFEGKTIKLESDVDLAGIAWKPVGNVTSYPSYTFSGTFDGQNHTISNLTASDFLPNHASAGLFGSIIGTVKNVKIENATIASSHYAGVICGYTSSNCAVIENCHVKNATVTSTPELLGNEYDNGDKVGGIIGYMVGGDKVTGCSVEDVTVKAYRDLGGIVGMANNNSAADVTNNKAKNCTIIQSNENGYKDKVTTYGAIIGRIENGVVPESNTVENVTVKSVEK